MKVRIGPYSNYIGPYQIAEKILFWIPKYDKNTFEYTEAYDKYVHRFGEWLSEDKNGNDSWLTKVCRWIESKRKRTIKIKIDHWDTWSMDSTLALIILPMLKQLRDTKHGSPMVDSEDVPEEMRLIDHEQWDSQECFDFYHEPSLQNIQCDVHDRWNWVLNEMIWAFEQIVDDDNDKQFWTGEHDIVWEPCEDNPNLSEMKHGPKHTAVFDSEGYQKHHDRIKRGLTLFGKYFRGLWD